MEYKNSILDRCENQAVSTCGPVYLSITGARQVASYILSVMQMSVNFTGGALLIDSPLLLLREMETLLLRRHSAKLQVLVVKMRPSTEGVNHRNSPLCIIHLVVFPQPGAAPSPQPSGDVVRCGLDTNETI
ncbi:hypothetical protein E2C01_035395 [Portunus trituberculatus]|uniref:Uncharacterized protein n=1 Tax=Portunus trituberculatus TaxID=210409 RepID=A0A5B7F435_PORTR|nr:hypothetical protein [Portunus trituberculatus]